MSSYPSTGRQNQKRRTRAALVTMATEMVRQGLTPTVTEVADAALISRSTAYRYFPSQELLMVEVGLDEIVRAELDVVDAASTQPGTAEDRLDAVVSADHAMQIKHEAAVRAALRAWVSREVTEGQSSVRRPGNRLRYAGEALAPVRERLGAERFERLVMALAMCMGIESVIVLKDICGLSDVEAEQVKRWAAAALLDAALRES